MQAAGRKGSSGASLGRGVVCVILATTGIAVLAQALVVDLAVAGLAAELPRDEPLLRAAWPGVLARSVAVTLAVVVPLVLALGLCAAARLFRPLRALEAFLRRVAAGEKPGACTLRRGDALHGLCELLNEATAPLRAGPPVTVPEEPAIFRLEDGIEAILEDGLDDDPEHDPGHDVGHDAGHDAGHDPGGERAARVA